MMTLAAGGAVRIDAMRTGAIVNCVFLGLAAALASVRNAIAARRHRLEALDAFHRFDARTLRDLGIERGRVMLSD